MLVLDLGLMDRFRYKVRRGFNVIKWTCWIDQWQKRISLFQKCETGEVVLIKTHRESGKTKKNVAGKNEAARDGLSPACQRAMMRCTENHFSDIDCRKC